MTKVLLDAHRTQRLLLDSTVYTFSIKIHIGCQVVVLAPSWLAVTKEILSYIILRDSSRGRGWEGVFPVKHATSVSELDDCR